MNPFKWCKRAAMAVLFCTLAFYLLPADAAFLYKSYSVKLDHGREILCDPNIVQKNDYVLKLLRQKGEIAADGAADIQERGPFAEPFESPSPWPPPQRPWAQIFSSAGLTFSPAPEAEITAST